MTTALLYYGYERYKQIQQAISNGQCPGCAHGTISTSNNGHTQECMESWNDFRNKLKKEERINNDNH